jgi:peptide deformylase
MILPVVAYGAPVLRKLCEPVDPAAAELPNLIADMYETMYKSNGVGLAAPQINKGIRIFVIDTVQIFDNYEEGDEKFPDAPGLKSAFINANIISLGGKEWSYNEGCLSIPKIREDVYRSESVTLSYLDENFQEHTRTFNGITARVILHEYDHIEGKLFIDYIKPLRKKLLQGKLNDINKGKIKFDYKMIFPK